VHHSSPRHLHPDLPAHAAASHPHPAPSPAARILSIPATTRAATPNIPQPATYPVVVLRDAPRHGVPLDASPNAHVLPLRAAIDAACARASGVPPRRLLLVHDAALPQSLVDHFARALAATAPALTLVPILATEAAKSLQTVESLAQAAAAARLERTDAFIALGGGVISDLTGFAAAVYRRGVPWVVIPTTLLAMVDAAVGGKTASNLTTSPPASSLLKNLLGAFHDPALVIADTHTLDSLDPRHLRAGLAECVKHAILDPAMPIRVGVSAWDFLRDWATRPATPNPTLHPLHALAPDLVLDFIAANIAFKARVVATDPFENAPDAHGGRALLNLGHTFGHALETMPGLTPIRADTGESLTPPMQHGEAVALGVVAAAHASSHLGLAHASLASDIERVLTGLGLPTRLRGLDSDAALLHAIHRMNDDKKAREGRLRLILPVSDAAAPARPAGARVVSANLFSALPEAIRAALEHLRAPSA
jgi:3-dehydroquinate synthetase